MHWVLLTEAPCWRAGEGRRKKKVMEEEDACKSGDSRDTRI